MREKQSSKPARQPSPSIERHGEQRSNKHKAFCGSQAANSKAVGNSVQRNHELEFDRQHSGNHKRKHESAFPEEVPSSSVRSTQKDLNTSVPRHGTSQKPASYTDVHKSVQPGRQQTKAISDRKLLSVSTQAPNPQASGRESSKPFQSKKQHCSSDAKNVTPESADEKGALLESSTDADVKAHNHKRQETENKAVPKSEGSKSKTAPSKSMLSFGDEMDIEEPKNGKFSLADTTHRKFAKERKAEDARPAPEYIADLLSLRRAGASQQQQDSSSNKKFLGQLCFGVSSTRGERAYMEDRHTVVASYSPQADGISRSFAAVYDGHNGAKAAEHCSSRLHVLLASNPAVGACTGALATDKGEEFRMAAALHGAFHAVDQEILQKSKEDGGRDGSTGLVLLRIGEVLYAAHCGDSRAVLSRAGQALQLTQDHKPDLPREAERIRQAGGRTDFSNCWRVILEPREDRPGSGLAVSRSFGDLDFKEPRRLVECEPDVGRWPLQEGDGFAVLASDGLWDVMSDQQAVDCVQEVLSSCSNVTAGKRSSDQDAKTAADALVAAAIRKGTLDNVTVIVCLLPWN